MLDLCTGRGRSGRKKLPSIVLLLIGLLEPTVRSVVTFRSLCNVGGKFNMAAATVQSLRGVWRTFVDKHSPFFIELKIFL